MKNVIKFILFLIYTVLIFFVNNYIILGLIAIINLCLILIKKISIKNWITNLLNLMPFILFTVIINLIFEDVNLAILIGIRLILVCNISFIYSKTQTISEFGQTLTKILYPLKFFKINPEEIGLIITIAISFIPIIKNEFVNFKNMLKIKGIKVNNINLIKNISIIFKPFFVSIIKRLEELENSLKVKGY